MNKSVVVLESPYAGDFERNEKYARRCMVDSLQRGEAPFMSHLLYTQVLDDTDLPQRKLGMEAGFAFIAVSEYTVVYEDYGISGGMKEGIKIAKGLGHVIEYRQIGKNDAEIDRLRAELKEAVEILDWCRGYVSGYSVGSESNLPKIDDFIHKVSTGVSAE